MVNTRMTKSVDSDIETTWKMKTKLSRRYMVIRSIESSKRQKYKRFCPRTMLTPQPQDSFNKLRNASTRNKPSITKRKSKLSEERKNAL